jgi:tetratricopeptide (TPR) repeat protein
MSSTSTTPSVSGSKQPPNTVRVYDAFGRELFIPVEEWRKNLHALMGKAASDPDELARLVLECLQLNQAEDATAASQHLLSIDTDLVRGACLRAIVLMKVDDPAEAEAVLNDYLAQHGADGSVLTNLAKAQEAQGRTAEADATLWSAIEADPNQENGLGWFAARERERNGVAAGDQALVRAANLPSAWRPQLLLAHEAFTRGGNAREGQENGMSWYHQSLEHAPKPVPGALLQTMSGDLGNAGMLREMLSETLPHYDARIHGLPVGNNIIKAWFDLGEFESARNTLSQLQALNRPDWMQHLQYWSTEIRKALLAATPPKLGASVSLLTIPCPLWLPEDSPAYPLFVQSTTVRPKVLFFGSCVVMPPDAIEAFKGQMPDAAGRLSRSLPLFLAERAFMEHGLDARLMLPWVDGGGFAITPAKPTYEQIWGWAAEVGARAAVAVSLTPGEEGVTVSVEMWKRAWKDEGEPAGLFSVEVPYNNLAMIHVVATRLSGLLTQALDNTADRMRDGKYDNLDAQTTPERYGLPADNGFADYILRLEQLLAVHCAARDPEANADFLFGEPEIVQGEINLALHLTGSLPLRLVLHETLLGMKKLRPDIVAVFEPPVRALQESYRLADAAAAAALDAQLQMIYSM